MFTGLMLQPAVVPQPPPPPPPPPPFTLMGMSTLRLTTSHSEDSNINDIRRNKNDRFSAYLINNSLLLTAASSSTDSSTIVNSGSAMEESMSRLFINSSSNDASDSSSEQVLPSATDRLLYRHSMAMSAVYCVAYIIVFVVGLIGNCFVIAVVYRSPRMRTVTNFFIVNLAVADVLVIVFCLPATLMSNIFVRKFIIIFYNSFVSHNIYI